MVNIETLHSVIAGMTTDYLDFFCKNCEHHIYSVHFYSIDSVGVQLMAKCEGCSEDYIFKIKVSIPLGPIEFLPPHERRGGYKKYDQRKIKKYLRKIGHPLYSKE